MNRSTFVTSRIYRGRHTILRAAITAASPAEGESLDVEFVTDAEDEAGVAYIERGTPNEERIEYEGVDELEDLLLDITRPDPLDHPAESVVVFGDDPEPVLLCDGVLEGTEQTSPGIIIEQQLWSLFREGNHEYVVEVDVDSSGEVLRVATGPLDIEPSINGALIEEGTAPAPAYVGDALAPATPSAAPTIDRQVRTNTVNMSAYTRPSDFRAYLPEWSNDYNDESPGSATWHTMGQTGANAPHIVDTDTPDLLLDFDTAYAYRYRVIDADNQMSGYSAVVSGVRPRRVNEGYDPEDPTTKPDVELGTVGAALLAAKIILAGLISTHDPDDPSHPQRVEIDTLGIRNYDENGDVMVSWPTTTGLRPFVRAVLEALGLDVTGDAIFRGTANQLAAGAILSLAANAGDPATAPTLTIEDSTSDLATTRTQSRRNLFYDASGYNPAGGTQATFLFVEGLTDSATFKVVECKASDGSVLRTVTLDSTRRPLGVCRTGSYVYVLTQGTNSAAVHIEKRNQSDLSFVNRTRVDVAGQLPADRHPALGWDPTDSRILVADGDFSTWDVYKYSIDGSGDPVFDAKRTTTTPTQDPSVGLFDHGIARVGSHYMFVQGTTKVHVALASTGADDSALRFDLPWKGAGITYDGSNIRTMSKVDQKKTNKQSNWLPANNIYCRYAWFDSVNTYESSRSPVASVAPATLLRRYLRVTVPSRPGVADRTRVYLATGASEPANSSYERQGNPSASGTADWNTPTDVVKLLDLQTSNAETPKTLSTFPAGGVPALLTAGVDDASNDPFQLYGDGMVRKGTRNRKTFRPVQFSNSAAEQDLWSITFAANELKVGTRIVIRAVGVIDHPNTAENWPLRTYTAGASRATLNPVMDATARTGRPFITETTIDITVVGTTGRAIVTSEWRGLQNTGGVQPVDHRIDYGGSAINFDTTIAQTIKQTIQMAAASAARVWLFNQVVVDIEWAQ